MSGCTLPYAPAELSVEQGRGLLREANVHVGQVWRHVKSQAFYRIAKIGLFENTKEPMICYEPIADGPEDEAWFRFLDDFLVVVEVEGRMTPRFVRVDD